jgi:hypothetical protein
MRTDLNFSQRFEIAPYLDSFAGTIFNVEPDTEGYEVARRMFLLGALVNCGLPQTEVEAGEINRDTNQTLFNAAQKTGKLGRLAAEVIDFSVAKWCETAAYIVARLAVLDEADGTDPVAFVRALYTQRIVHYAEPDEARGLDRLP